MRPTSRLSLAAVLAAIVVASSAPSAQRIARTPDGKPDLQGMWLNDTATPLERPRDLGSRSTFTDEEARAYEQRYQIDRTIAIARIDPAIELEIASDLDTYEPGKLLPGNRASMITDPPDGRVPALTPAAQQRLAARTEHLRVHYAENPEDFPNTERCLMIGNASSPPMLPVFYNNNLQIVQTNTHVVMLSEMIHDARIVALDGRPHLPAGIGQWKGHSVGRWEGDTLVVDTKNFSEKTAFRGSGPTLHVVERFTLSDPNTLKYEFTVDDPATFVRPWSGSSQLTRTDGQMYEYACHEANYSLAYILRGARFSEK